MNCHLRGMDALEHPQQKPNLSVLKNWTVHLKRKKNVTVPGIKPTRNNFSPEKFRPLSWRWRGRREKTRGKFEISQHWRIFSSQKWTFWTGVDLRFFEQLPEPETKRRWAGSTPSSAAPSTSSRPTMATRRTTSRSWTSKVRIHTY